MKSDTNFKLSKQTKIYMSFEKHKKSLLKDMFIDAEITEAKAKKARMKEREKTGQGDE